MQHFTITIINEAEKSMFFNDTESVKYVTFHPETNNICANIGTMLIYLGKRLCLN